jgi:hypothetical protein
MGREGQAKVQRYETMARQGDRDAMCRLAILLAPSDPDEAVRWYTRAAELGHRGSMYNLGAMIVKARPHEARKWWERAAALDDPGAMYGLGTLAAQDGDADEANRWFEKAEGTGDPLVSYWLALGLEKESPERSRQLPEKAAANDQAPATYKLALLVEKEDLARSKQLLERAARAGNINAAAQLGLLLVTKDPHAAQPWMERAAAGGHYYAMGNLGKLFNDRGDRDEARRWWKLATDKGAVQSMYDIAKSVEAIDPAQAEHYYAEAVSRDHVWSMVAWGCMQRDADPQAARENFERAAALGNSAAMHNLGLMARDDGQLEEARRWYEQGAALGEVRSMLALAELAGKKDRAEALRWYESEVPARLAQRQCRARKGNTLAQVEMAMALGALPGGQQRLFLPFGTAPHGPRLRKGRPSEESITGDYVAV